MGTSCLRNLHHYPKKSRVQVTSASGHMYAPEFERVWQAAAALTWNSSVHFLQGL
jgi:hypothetical protein